MIQSTISETKNRLSELLKKVRSGETLIIMDRKIPVARVEAVVCVSGHPSLASPREKWNPKTVLSLPIARGGKGKKSLVQAVAEERDAGW